MRPSERNTMPHDHGVLPMHANARRSAFTLVELLVAVSITVGLLFLISRVFFDTTTAVSRGVATSGSVDSSRMVGDQFNRDFSALVGPNSGSGGFLVIIKHKILGVPFQLSENSDPTQGTQDVQDDQVIFIADASATNTINALTPGTDTSFTNTSTATHARVSYSIGQRTFTNGADGPALVGPNFDEPNRYANQFILTRQALMLAGGAASSVHVIGATTTGDVTVYTGLPCPTKLYMGLSDVSNIDLLGLLGTLATPATSTAVYAPTVFPYTFGDARLRVNPFAEGGSFESWKIAQTHGQFVSGVSDFRVDFAADTNNDGKIDVDATSGDIIWYDDSNYASVAGYDYAWTAGVKNTAPFIAAPSLTYASSAFVWRHDDDKAYTETVPGTGDADNSAWPYMLRIRYRLHDAKGRLTSNLNNSATPTQGRWFEEIVKINRP